MSTFHKSQLRQVVEAINENAVEIIQNVAEATYLQEHQAQIYMQGRIAESILEKVPSGKVRVEVTHKWDMHELMSRKYDVVANFVLNDVFYVHCVRVLAKSSPIHDNYILPTTTYSLVEKSSWPQFAFEDVVHQLAEEQFQWVLGDPKLSSSDVIELWEERILEALVKRYNRDSFEASLTVSHGADRITFTGTIEDVGEGYSVTVETTEAGPKATTPDKTLEEIIPSALAQLLDDVSRLNEVIIGIEEDGQDPARARLVAKMTKIATPELIEAYLAVEQRVTESSSLEHIQRSIRNKLTEELNDLNFTVLVSYYTPTKSVNVAIVENNSNVTLSLVAIRK